MSQAPSPAPPMVRAQDRLRTARAARQRRCRRRRRAPGRSSRRATGAEARRGRPRGSRALPHRRRPLPRLSSRSAARRRAPSWKRGSSPSTSRAGWMPRIEEASRSSSAAAIRSSVSALLARGMECEHSRPDRAGQLTAVERRCDEVGALHDEHVGVAGLENVAVEVDDQRHRVQALGQLVEQPPVAPLVSAQPAGQDRRREHHRIRRRLGSERLEPRSRPVSSWRAIRRRCSGAAAAAASTRVVQVARQLGAVQRLHAPLEPGQVGAEVDGHAAADQDRLEHSERGVGPVGAARERGHRGDPASRAAPRSAARPRRRSPGAPSRSTPRARSPRPSRPRCRRPRPSRSARRASRAFGWRRSAPVRRPGSRTRSRPCTPRVRRPRARRSRASPGSSARR